MRSFAIAFSRQGKPVSQGAFKALAGRLRYGSSESSKCLSFGPFSVGTNAGAGDPGLQHRGYLVSANVAVVFNGRLDNRAELSRLLGIGATAADDATIALAAWRHWRRGSFRRFKGPMVVAVLDRSARSLTLYRDRLGCRSVFYRISAGLFVAGSRPEPLTGFGGAQPLPDPDWIARYFALSRIRDNHTAFAMVKELLPGEVLTCDMDSLCINREPAGFGADKIRYQNIDDYAWQYKFLLEQSVSRCLDGVGNPGLMLSGGVDSSCAAAVAAQAVNPGGSQATAYSWSLGQFPGADESACIRQTAEFLDINHVLLAADELWPGQDLAHWPVTPDSPASNAFERLKALVYAAAQRDGVQILLNGAFADRLYPHPALKLVNMFHDRQFKRLPGELSWILVHKGIGGALRDSALRRLAREVLPRRPGRTVDQKIWLTPYAGDIADAGERWPPELAAGELPEQYEGLFGVNFARGTAGVEPFTFPYDVEIRDPYTDVDLVDFMLSLPYHVFFHHGHSKWIARLAMRGMLPDATRLRPRVGQLNEFFNHGILQSLPAIRPLLLDAESDLDTYIDRNWMMRVLDSDRRTDTESLVLWQCVTYRLWLNKLAAVRSA